MERALRAAPSSNVAAFAHAQTAAAQRALTASSTSLRLALIRVLMGLRAGLSVTAALRPLASSNELRQLLSDSFVDCV